MEKNYYSVMYHNCTVYHLLFTERDFFLYFYFLLGAFPYQIWSF